MGETKTKMIKIPAPIANLREKVWVLNYRKNPQMLETGIVSMLAYENMFGDWKWTYTIRLDRISKAGNSILLYVVDDKLEKYYA